MSIRRMMLVFLSAMTVVVVAQGATGTTLQSATLPDGGTYLVDGEGRSVYLFTADPKNDSTCVDACAEAWPPVLVEGELVAGSGVAATLLGTVTRADGTTQLAYFGIPLYYYASDLEPGQTNGQGVNDVWYLVSPFGSAILPPKPAEPESVAGDTSDEVTHMELATLLGAGQTVFSQHCATCHGARGEGGVGPKLAGTALDDDRRNIRQVLFGGGHMPAFGGVLDDEQIAAVVTYIRKSWGNDFPVVTAEEVVAYR